ncbi:hypothetical protein ACO0K9_19325 [Undibacterium sp. Ji50W]|uniref:hypothetical protein n=1 Tax=Undibacterium sp. Ji50W TaxID=3413041 RepID=UPI003BF450C0
MSILTKSSPRDSIIKITVRPRDWFFRNSYQRGLVLLFAASCLAVIIPVFPHDFHFVWIWACVGAASMCMAYTTAIHNTDGGEGAYAYIRCVALLGVAMLVDFCRIPPEIVLSECRSGDGRTYASVVMQHIATHFRCFPVGSLAMLSIVFLTKKDRLMAAESPERISLARRLIQNHVVQGIAGSFSMFGLMGVTMDLMLKLSARTNLVMDGGGIVSAMICGMAAYHMMVNCWKRLLLCSNNVAHRVLSR